MHTFHSQVSLCHNIVNNIRGTIPSEWGQMTRLTSLCVAVNQLTGSIPSTFSSMSNLENMSLYKNRLTGLIPEPRDWSSLVYMDFSDNQLEGEIPIFLGKRAPKLVNFFMENNRLSGWLPQDPSGFSALESIDLGYNLLSGTIPSGWMELRSLRDFCVAGNYLSGSIPSEVLRMSNIEALILVREQMSRCVCVAKRTSMFVG
jgi:Leucine-rich repeat (LRR) protein